MKIDILGVKIDEVNMAQAVELVLKWLAKLPTTNYKLPTRYIVTPNPEFIVAAQKDQEFREILNKADLAIPDSARLGWAKAVLEEKNPLLKLLKWKFFLFPGLFKSNVVAGTDLMEVLTKKSAEKAFTIGFLGGGKGVAERLGKVLIGKNPELKITFVDSGGMIDESGNQVDVLSSKYYVLSEETKKAETHNTKYIIPNTDLLFVAFGHIKQEKWIAKNLNKYPVKVMMGVGGAFDYLYGGIPRAPKILRSLGLEWIFRLLVQPWRIKRFGALVKFLILVLIKK